MQLPFGKKDAQDKDGADDKKKRGKDAAAKPETSAGKKRGTASKSKAASSKTAGKRTHVDKREKLAEPTGIFAAPAQIMGPRLAFIAAVVILCMLGLVMIYSSSSIEAYGDSTFGNNPFYFFKQQVVWLVVGTAACVAAALIPYSFWKSPHVAYFLWGVTFVLLAAVAAGLGTTSLGADRSLRLGPISVQPAEFAKVTVILLMASILERRNMGTISSSRAYGEMGLIACLTLVLIYKQPDLGTAIILLVGVVSLLILAGVNMKPILIIIGVCALYVAVVCFVQPYHLDRIKMMVDPWSDAQGNGYQSVQGFLAFGSGGIFGTGLGMSRQKYDYLPYAYNDFIYAVIGEELGLVGALFTLLVFAVLIYSGIRIAHTAKDVHGAIIAGSLTCMIGFQACVNMACVVGMAPVTGKALPFISYGGSSLLATMIMCGLILSVSIRSRLDNQVEKRRENLVVVDGGKAAVRQGGVAAGAGKAAGSGALGSVLGRVAGAVGGAVGSAAEHLPGGASSAPARSGRSSGRGGNAQRADDGRSVADARSDAARDSRGSRRSSRLNGEPSGNRGDGGRVGYSSTNSRASSRSASRSGASRTESRGAGVKRASYGGSRSGITGNANGYGSTSRERSENVDAGHGYRHTSSGRTTRAGFSAASNVSDNGTSHGTQREQKPQASRRSRSRKGDMDLGLVDIRPREGRRSSQHDSVGEDGASGSQRSQRNNGRSGNGRPRSSSASHGGTSRRR